MSLKIDQQHGASCSARGSPAVTAATAMRATAAAARVPGCAPPRPQRAPRLVAFSNAPAQQQQQQQQQHAEPPSPHRSSSVNAAATALAAVAVASAGLFGGAPPCAAAAPAPAETFAAKCAGCHINGGNVLAAGATLFTADLERNGRATADAVYDIIYRGKGKMPGFGLECAPKGACTFGPRFTDDEVREQAEYVLARAAEGWKAAAAAAAGP